MQPPCQRAFTEHLLYAGNKVPLVSLTEAWPGNPMPQVEKPKAGWGHQDVALLCAAAAAPRAHLLSFAGLFLPAFCMCIHFRAKETRGQRSREELALNSSAGGQGSGQGSELGSSVNPLSPGAGLVSPNRSPVQSYDSCCEPRTGPFFPSYPSRAQVSRLSQNHQEPVCWAGVPSSPPPADSPDELC